MEMDETIIIKKDAVKLVRIREELIDEVSLRTDGTHLSPCFHIYYRKAPFTSVYVDLVNGSLWRVMKEREQIDAKLWWETEIPPKGSYYYRTEHFENVWKDVALALESYILPYMDAMSVKKLLSFMVEHNRREEDYFRVRQIVYFSDKYFACMDQAAVYGVGMWIEGRYSEGLPYIIFAQNKYREHIRPHELEKEQFNEGRVLGILDTLIDIYERKPQELGNTVRQLTDKIALNWADYMM